MSQALDPTLYVRAPRLSVASGLSLAKMLLTLVPTPSTPGVQRAARELRTAATTLERAWKAQSKPQRALDARPFDRRLDRAWSAISSRLANYEVFDADNPDRIRAEQLDALLFPTGLDFIVLPYLAQHAQSGRRIEQLATDPALSTDLARLVGDAFVRELDQAHEAYGEALGITKAAPQGPEPISLVEPLRALTQAVGGYALQVLAFADSDPDHLAAGRRALEPIDKFRRAASRRSGSAASEDAGPEADPELPEDAPEPDAPLPELPLT